MGNISSYCSIFFFPVILRVSVNKSRVLILLGEKTKILVKYISYNLYKTK